MAQLDEILQQVLSQTTEILGIAVIEINSRQLVGSAQLTTTLSPATLEALAVSAVEMLRGKAVSAIELLLSDNLNEPIKNSIDDVCINTKNIRFFLAVIHEKPEFLLLLSTNTTLSMGMGWMLVRQNMPLIVEKLP